MNWNLFLKNIENKGFSGYLKKEKSMAWTLLKQNCKTLQNTTNKKEK
jgi:hypothetical protein